LTFIHEANPLYLQESLVNFSRLQLFAKTIRSTYVGCHAASNYHLDFEAALVRLVAEVLVVVVGIGW
jgi:hypothetical protein